MLSLRRKILILLGLLATQQRAQISFFQSCPSGLVKKTKQVGPISTFKGDAGVCDKLSLFFLSAHYSC